MQCLVKGETLVIKPDASARTMIVSERTFYYTLLEIAPEYGLLRVYQSLYLSEYSIKLQTNIIMTLLVYVCAIIFMIYMINYNKKRE